MAANIFATGMDAFDRSYDRGQSMQQDRAKMQAGRSLASGDRQGAMQAFGSAGLTDDVRQVQGDQMRVDLIAKQDEQQDYDRKHGEAKQRADVLVRVAQGLKSVPAGQRKAALAGIAPVFGKVGVDPSMFNDLTEEQLDDAALDMFSGEVEKQFQAVNLGGGGFGTFDGRTGKFQTLREPTIRPVIMGNGASALDPETGEVIARNPKTFAPPRASSGGGGGLGALSTAELLAAVRGR